jgi:hypothetical protein
LHLLRGAAAEAVGVEEAQVMSEMELVVIKTFLNRMDAELAKGALDANGIEALIRADDAGGTRPSLWTGGVELLVRADDVETASIVLGAS